MFPREFDYVAPQSLDDAVRILADNPSAKVLAGGMSLVPLMKMRLFSPSLVVDIGSIPGLDSIQEHEEYISIGALVRHRQTASDPLIATNATAIAQAASWTGDIQVQNRGTTCGSLAHADSAADQAAGALACGGIMVAKSVNGIREIAAQDFFIDMLVSALKSNEILTELRIPKAGAGESSAYDKLGRRGGRSGYAVAGAAAWVRLEGDAVADARVALTGVDTKPALASGVAEALVGTDGSLAVIEKAAERSLEGVAVTGDLYGSDEYKEHLARVYVGRALASALGTV